ncbi:phosphatidylglycerol lysyltransferase domain-containing protein [uncultured Roseovarius sp.]|uniref:phosphatidylglycerol lysyltransferase domain-containing protein n=1 Tax=uncultured Roseovarius sp. TaxID=293344 RepID=UPI00260D570B|nr:phosphatidylglycerol lysyltransferase domain-containing protein [uncultured Roseovarius sp.]
MQYVTNSLRRRALPVSKIILPLAIAGICLWVLHQRLDAGAMNEIGSALQQLNMRQWVLAALATGVSFWAIGRYDVIIHRHIGTGCSPRQAGIVGAASIALGQLLGMGAVVGALVRWRMLKGISAAQATRIALTVTGWFFFGLIGVFALVSLVGPVVILPEMAAFLVILSLIAIALRSFLNPELTLFGRCFRLLSLPALGGILTLTLIDTAAAALALWILMPQGFDAGFAILFPVYLAALTAALITGTPGGVGPFELSLLVFLPHWPEAELMSGIVAFRLVYYAVPAVIAMMVLCKSFPACRPAEQMATGITETLIANAPRAETGVCRQNGASLISSGRTTLAVTKTHQAQIALFDPLRGKTRDALGPLKAVARGSNRCAMIYKASGRHAAACRQGGWKVFHIADEAVLNPVMFTLEGPALRQLRRKLRQADRASIIARRAGDLPVHHMRAIDAEWQARSGHARGFSMGVFCPDYLRHRRVYLAYHEDVIVGFVSFHVSAGEICLDLMRTGADAPDGTMHALIMAAISEAATEGRTRLSLAALPPRSHKNLVFSVILRRFTDAGLSRFKTCFAPVRVPLYALSPSWPGMALALLDVARAVHLPNANPAHTHNEDYEFAPHRQT